MGKLNFFRSRKSDNIQEPEDRCVNLTDSFECSIVSEIRHYQNQMQDVNQRIAEIEQCCIEITEIKKLLTSREMRMVYSCIYNSIRPPQDIWLGESDTRALQFAIYSVDDVDKLCEEIKTVYNKERILSELRSEASGLSKKISELKSKLGIK